jgi:hypothetical protein
MRSKGKYNLDHIPTDLILKRLRLKHSSQNPDVQHCPSVFAKIG